jgi:uncharacterized protein YeaC (DUF1315 family)|tara:strand:+ start:28253 stop:28507 length:255 start_codon:yes stop_codon:yes gene_type:complete
MKYQELVESMPRETFESLKRAVELGKWPDGKALTSEQRENALQAIIAWGQRHLSEQDRVGHLERKKKTVEDCDSPPETPLSWKE